MVTGAEAGIHILDWEVVAESTLGTAGSLSTPKPASCEMLSPAKPTLPMPPKRLYHPGTIG